MRKYLVTYEDGSESESFDTDMRMVLTVNEQILGRPEPVRIERICD
jgi:hypothetical protein